MFQVQGQGRIRRNSPILKNESGKRAGPPGNVWRNPEWEPSTASENNENRSPKNGRSKTIRNINALETDVGNRGKEVSEGTTNEDGINGGRRRTNKRTVTVPINTVRNIPTILITSPNLEGKARLMVDSGSDVNLIKKSMVTASTIVNTQEIIYIRGIIDSNQATLGTASIMIANHPVNFHVVNDALFDDEGGILGSEFLLHQEASIDYAKRQIKWGNNYIPFNTYEEIFGPKRSSVPFHINIANPELREGYVGKLHVKEGIYLGNALVTNREGKAHMRIINSTDEDCNVVVPTIEILPFEERSYKRCNLTKISKENRFEEILKLLRLDHLNMEEKENMMQLIKENEDRFHLAGEILEGTDSIQHRIHTTDDIPINTRQYRYLPVHKDEINQQINELLETGVIESSSSPYSSPIWIVPKKPDSTGKKRWRVVIDYRKLNEKTIGDAYPLPNITEILDQVGSAKYFSTFDLASGFHQIKMAPDDVHKTAFSTPYGHYQFTRMPFGLKNAPATFQRLMNSVLSGFQGTELFVYLDDIVIYSRSLREHEIKFTRLMKRLREAKLMLQPDKCEFLRHEVIYLGHIIDEHGVKPDPKNIEAVENFPRPKTPKNIKQFLGLIGYYRRFIPEFSRKSKPLTNLLKKTTKFVWDKEEEEAFQILKNVGLFGCLNIRTA